MAKGSCLCGSVKFTVGGEISSMSHCHCSMCRKLHGSQFATYFNASEHPASTVPFVNTADQFYLKNQTPVRQKVNTS